MFVLPYSKKEYLLQTVLTTYFIPKCVDHNITVCSGAQPTQDMQKNSQMWTDIILLRKLRNILIFKI